jgi:hypothetical protein
MFENTDQNIIDKNNNLNEENKITNENYYFFTLKPKVLGYFAKEFHVTMDLFANPFSSYFPQFCSYFVDIDTYFGSRG